MGRQCWSFLEGVFDEFLAARGNALFDLFDHKDGRGWWILSLSEPEMTVQALEKAGELSSKSRPVDCGFSKDLLN